MFSNTTRPAKSRSIGLRRLPSLKGGDSSGTGSAPGVNSWRAKAGLAMARMRIATDQTHVSRHSHSPQLRLAHWMRSDAAAFHLCRIGQQSSSVREVGALAARVRP